MRNRGIRVFYELHNQVLSLDQRLRLKNFQLCYCPSHSQELILFFLLQRKQKPLDENVLNFLLASLQN